MNPAPFDVVDPNAVPLIPLWNIPFRRFSSRNPFLGDFDLDGYQDLVIVPGSGFGPHQDKTWVLRNTTGNVLDNSSIDLTLHYDPLAAPGHPNNSFGVGAKVEVQADLDGDGVLDTWDPFGTGISVPRKQYQEMFLGGGNGASSTSPSLHFGLGQTGKNTFQDNVVIQVTWPCGHLQEKKITIAAVNTQLPLAIDFDSSLPTAHPLLIQDLTFSTPVVDGLGNYPAGMNPLIVEGDITLNALPPGIDSAKAIRQVEIGLRPAGTSGPFLPVATVKADSFAHFQAPITPLLLASATTSFTDGCGMVAEKPLQNTFFDVRVRVSDTFGNAYQEESDVENPQLRVKPEVLFEGMNFVNMNLMGGAGSSSGNTGLLMPQGQGVSEIEFPDLVFPGWTDKVVYWLLVKASNEGSSATPGELTVTCPNDAFQIAVPICSATAKEYAIPIEIPVPVKEKIVPVVLSNTGNTQLTIEKVFRCRRDKGL